MTSTSPFVRSVRLGISAEIAICLVLFHGARDLFPGSYGCSLARAWRRGERSEISLRAISAFPDGFPEVASHMGRLKKVPPRSARVRKKIEEKLAFVESNQHPAGSKAHVPAPIRYTERLALAPESWPFWRLILRNLGPGPVTIACGLEIFWTCELATLKKHRILLDLVWPLVARNYGIQALCDERSESLRGAFRGR